MKKPLPDGSVEGGNGSKAFAHQLMSQFSLGEYAARFSVVSFAAEATTRVSWSYDAAVINAGIDDMLADGKTSISDGFEAVRQLFADDGRVGATRIMLLLSDGEQSDQFSAPGKTPLETVVDAAALVKGDGVTVFAWGFGKKVPFKMLKQLASDTSKPMVMLADDMPELNKYLDQLKTAVCATDNLVPIPGPQ